MSIDILLHSIQQYGYFALFFALWLGIVGMPIPDEAIVMTGGMVVSMHWPQPLPSFALTYMGVVSGLSLGYVLGRWMGAPVLEKLGKKAKLAAAIERSQKLLARYGPYTLIISYFLPVVRHVVPYLVGINRMPFGRYALFSYTTGFVWTSLFFAAGYFFGDRMEAIHAAVTRYGWYALGAAVIGFAAYKLVEGAKRKRGLRLRERHNSDY
ncbi:DedA family protein [Paenibacillus sp. P25]|nr:DedA family protein [Paenibacillus sp. P25]